MIKLLVILLERLCYKLGKQVVIADRASDGQQRDRPYLVRTIVAQNKYFCIYIHRFLCSDNETYHDHPWGFWSYVVSGGYTEYVLPLRNEHVGQVSAFHAPTIKTRNPGSLEYRRASDIHRVVIDKDRTLDEINDAPLTICFMGPRVREWGFWPENEYYKMTNNSNVSFRHFIKWTDFLRLTPNQKTHYEKRP